MRVKRANPIRAASLAVLLAGALAFAVASWDTEPLPCADHRTGRIFQPSNPPDAPPLVRVTAYCHCPVCCGQWADGFTASGARAIEGTTIAADPEYWPMGTCLSLPGIGERIVQDTGSAIVGPRLDVYFDSHLDALEFGVRWLMTGEC